MLLMCLGAQVFSCKMFSKKKANSELKQVLSEVDKLNSQRVTDLNKYKGLFREYLRIRKSDNSLVSNSTNRDMVIDFLGKFPVTKCTATFIEPKEDLYSSSGFTAPLRLSLDCPEIKHPWFAAVSAPNLGIKPQAIPSPKPRVDTGLDVTQASFNGLENVLSLNAFYFPHLLLSTLQTDFQTQNNFTINVSPSKYQLKTATAAATRSYAKFQNGKQAAELMARAGTRAYEGSVAISKSGQFTIGGSYQNESFDLMYGHPNRAKPNGIGTSWTTVRIDDINYRLDKYPGSAFPGENGELVYMAKIGDTGVRIVQTLKPEAIGNRINTKISYELINEGSKDRMVGLRLLLDTWSGKNDGVPFVLPTGHGDQLHQTEVEFTPTASLMWQSFDLQQLYDESNKAMLLLQGLSVGAGLIPPNKMALVNWSEAMKTEWDYKVSRSRKVTGDSAVLMWWFPVLVKQKRWLEMATQVGTLVQRKGPSLFLSDVKRGIVILYLWHHNPSDKEQTVEYQIKSSRGKISLYGADKLKVPLGPRRTYIKATMARLSEIGKLSVIIKELIDGKSTRHEFKLNIPVNWGHVTVRPVTHPSSVLPVVYYHKKRMKLKARLQNRKGQVLGAVRLKRKKIPNGFKYSGKFRVAKIKPGRYAVQVVK